MADDIGAAGSASAAAPSAASTPASTPAPSAVQPASATVTPAPSDPSAPTQPQSGEPPRERWDAILQNARTKTRSEVEAEYRQKYGWADDAQRDPWGFTQRQLDQLATHPEYRQHVLSYMGKLLQSQRQMAGPPKPDVPVVDGQGNVTSYVYSAQQQARYLAWERQQADAQLSQKLAPLEKFVQAAQQREQHEQVRQFSEQYAQTRLGELRQNPLFTQHESAIRQALLEHEEWGDNIDRAFAHVLATHAIPNEQRRVMDTLQTKAAAGTVNPAAAAATQTPKFKSFGDALRYYAEHPDEAKLTAHR